MVFSFFKKPTEKMPERPAARPRAREADTEEQKPAAASEPVKAPAAPLPDLDFSHSPVPSKESAKKPAPPPEEEGFESDFSTWSDVGISVDQDVDPIDAGVEQVVVLFANGQDAAARSLLESFVQAYHSTEGKRFWLMLFDLYQVLGDRPAYDKLGVDYVHSCEISPPPWHNYAASKASVQQTANGVRKLNLQGVLTHEHPETLSELLSLLKQKTPVVLDFSKLAGCDDICAGQLAELLSKARKAKLDVSLESYEAFMQRLNSQSVAGQATHEPLWRLLLELLQRHGHQDSFEERAVDYAITFELSPPSWENLPPAQPKAATASAHVSDDAHYLSGELKNCRFEDLIPVLERSQHPIIDFSAVTRLDFVSAGQLVNRLTPYKAKGKDITIRGPNRLVAELLAIVGLNKQIRIVVPKH